MWSNQQAMEEIGPSSLSKKRYFIHSMTRSLAVFKSLKVPKASRRQLRLDAILEFSIDPLGDIFWYTP